MLESQDLREFSVNNWYEKFKHISLETIIIDLPNELLQEIVSDEIDEDTEGKEFHVSPNEQVRDKTTFLEQFKNAVNALNNVVFVKNNWHAPLDARMFSLGNSLKVMNIDDIILYFTSSSVIQEDFTHAKNIQFCMALRKWINIHPAAEFRCIVINNSLRGITPRDWPTYYAHFKEDGPQIVEEVTNFYNDNIKLKFSRSSFTFDIILQYPDRPTIVDFGPLNSKTDLYAFTWKEIQPLLDKEVPENVAPVFRYLESDIGIMTRGSALNKFTKKC